MPLYIVATPIGNLEDITIRAINVLKAADIILAEDTRKSRILLNKIGVYKKPISLNKDNEHTKIQYIINNLKLCKKIALISDAGTPTIQDPGKILSSQAILNNIEITPIPGACSLIAALSIAGFDSNKFVFEGFLSNKKNERLKLFNNIKNSEKTFVIYEAPHRILNSLKEMSEILDNRNIVVAKELTKIHEKIFRGTAEEMFKEIQSNLEYQKGEFVLIIEGNLDKNAKQVKNNMNEKDIENAKQIYDILKKELETKKAIAITSKITKLNKKILYKNLAIPNHSDF